MKKLVLPVMLALLSAGPAMADDTIWTRTWAPGGPVRVFAFSTVQLGADFVVSGGVQDTVALTSDIYIIRYSGDGAGLWTRVFDLDSFARDAVVSAGPGGELYVAAKVKMTPTWSMLARLDPADGDTLWTRVQPNACCADLVPDAEGVWLLGALGQPRPRDTLWLGRYDAAGNQTVHRSWRLAEREHMVAGFCRTRAGDLVGGVNLQGTVMLVGFSGDGDTTWTRELPTELAQSGLALAPAEGGDFYFLGQTSERVLLARMSPAGETLWTATVTTTGRIASDLATDPEGNAYIAMTEAGDFAVLQFSPAGRLLGRVRGGTADDDIAVALTVGGGHHPVVTGITRGRTAALTVKFEPPSGIAEPVTGPGPAGMSLLGASAGRPRLVVTRAGGYRLGLFGADGRRLAQEARWLEPGAHELGLDPGPGVRYLVVSGPAGTGRFKLVRAE